MKFVHKYSSVINTNLDKMSSHIFVTLRYRDEDPILEKPVAVIITNYASITIISNFKKHIRTERH